MSERPHRPLVVKCGYEGLTRRVNFPNAVTCRLDSLTTRIEECFSLSAAPFHLTYTDDDGEDFSIHSEHDLSDAISYFLSADDDQSALSNHVGTSSSVQKIQIRLEVVVEYDGPSLSDTSSILESGTGTEGESGSAYGSWRESNYTDSLRSHKLETDEGLTEYGGGSLNSTSRSSRIPRSQPIVDPGPPAGAHDRPGYASNASSLSATASDEGHLERSRTPQPLTGPNSEVAPSLLTHSELGSRWLREQSHLASRRIGPPGRAGHRPARRTIDDGQSSESDEESLGDLALVKDSRGKYYYSYQTSDSASQWSGDGVRQVAGRVQDLALDETSSRFSGLASNVAQGTPPSKVDVATFSGSPRLAPDCSACGMRLDYMRYVCWSCGEGEMWKENAPGKAAFLPSRALPLSTSSQSSSITEWTEGASPSSNGTAHLQFRARSSSTTTHASGEIPLEAEDSRVPSHDSGEESDGFHKQTTRTSRGYELCPSCVEVHGIAHAKAAARDAKLGILVDGVRRRSRHRELRHTFREKIWGSMGWIDVAYTEEAECTICHTTLRADRFKCISCAKFDLCRSCYQKVDEIHPAHAFLALPDLIVAHADLPNAGPSRSAHRPIASKPVRHPGAFCHNCLQDIVGPRFHCAVCPSWDLCIQCEGIAASSTGSTHTADHIMMKIPIPLATAEVEAVSRLARDRWTLQDSVTVSTSSPSDGHSSRSASPTNETVYASPINYTNLRARGDDLDHGCRCNGCNQWIKGKRFQCANCPSDPTAFNLCSVCERRSYQLHDPYHAFFKLNRPVHIPLKSALPLLPILHRNPVGKLPAPIAQNTNPTAYLRRVLHRETLCDIHGDQIRGMWLRCAHCAAGFDICQEAEAIADHDASHVFVVFKAKVDMAAFRNLADLNSTHSKPLLSQHVYLS